MAADPRDFIRKRAAELGFSVCRFADVRDPWLAGERLKSFVESDYHGEMAWMETTLERRSHPNGMWEGAETAIVLGMNYGPDHDPRPELDEAANGYISVYARGDDYHEVIKGRLKILAGQIAARLGEEVKVFVDTAPLMEKPLAERSGMGWQGKHTNLLSRELGSWFFIGTILTTAKIEADKAEVQYCGSCRACLDACPTKAFPAPFQLDARRCLSYLTIEYGGVWPREFRSMTGNRIYGCDDCLAACPWNKFAQTAQETRLQAREALVSPKLADLLLLDDAAFRALFTKSPVKRIGRNRFIRNVLHAAGNSNDADLIAPVEGLLDDPDAVVRATAVWALKQLSPQNFETAKKEKLPTESEASVRSEWEA
ncbi:tRNA epoxyqueuosine(34) reductase QueG [Brevundimonas pishanensis]|uniref:tRNA epoxyqueuosine(34) reductase QueG n=1 Tax=Brevundimonas pishanensis TaxID=2896315 RepID=UPI001FA80048|nr:tRNA epoxyqueuosine(34) reductase QueG [Brevundimonas pishanensis]